MLRDDHLVVITEQFQGTRTLPSGALNERATAEYTKSSRLGLEARNSHVKRTKPLLVKSFTHNHITSNSRKSSCIGWSHVNIELLFRFEKRNIVNNARSFV